MKNLRLSVWLALPLLGLVLWAGLAVPGQEKGLPLVNTQNPKDRPPTPQESLGMITAPPGFNVTLFAGEPDVRQPIAMCLDDRGRLWVAECYTYSGASGTKAWVADHRDRLVIFEDEDNDGRFDKRKVFQDQFHNLSGVATGFGGVWVLATPNLLFIPDRNGDDVADGPPQVMLDGFVVGQIGHNVVNGLTWGPDGWLYGRHGIQDTSHVGTPGTPPAQRTKLNCSIWRYHPTKKTFEVVTHGTTNPWGFDYDDHGQMFFTNNVNGHLFHIIPGAHYKRMYGEDFNPHLYELIDPHADHDHYDSSKSWNDAREGKKTDERGGGHSHVGAMIYLGDNWPDQYRNTIFMCNTHGRRVNNDILVRQGSGYVGKHGKDFLFANNPWFRGIDLKYGPDGGVYISDWTDLGECHDHDGIHRTSGRIYKVTYGKVAPPKIKDASKLSDAELVKLQLHKNDWYVRTARRLLQERAAEGKDMKAVHEQLMEIFDKNPDVTRKLRAMWTLYVTRPPGALWLLKEVKQNGGEAIFTLQGKSDSFPEWLKNQLKHENEYVRVWAIRLLVDDHQAITNLIEESVRSNKALNNRIEEMTRTETSPLVRLSLASAMQRVPNYFRTKMAEGLLQHAEDANDHNTPLMIWYGLEAVVAEPNRLGDVLHLTNISRIPKLRQFISRRLTEEIAKKPAPVDALVQLALAQQPPAFQLDILRGMSEGLQGWHKAKAPGSWKALKAKLGNSPDAEVKKYVQALSVIFGDGLAITELKALALNAKADGNARRAALKALIDAKSDDLLPTLTKLVNDRATVGLAMKGLALYDDPKIPGLILNNYRFLKMEDRPAAVDTLVSRPAFAAELLKALAAGKIDREEISAFHARQIQSLGRDDLKKLLAKHWGDIRTTPAEKKQQIEQLKKKLDADSLGAANLVKGRLLFNQSCANCHKLFGEGKSNGPDLTGGNRDNLDYLLENIIDPNAVVPVGFRMSVVSLKNGRVITGVITKQTEQVLSVQSQNETHQLNRAEVDEILPTALSLMPDGLLAPLSQEQVRDLIAYLMTRQQVALPEETSKK